MGSESFSYKTLNTEILLLSFGVSVLITTQIFRNSNFFSPDGSLQHQNVLEILTFSHWNYICQAAACIWK